MTTTDRDPRPATPSRWWSRNLVVLCGVSFLQDTASELLYPILPIFLTVTLGVPWAKSEANLRTAPGDALLGAPPECRPAGL